MSGASETREPKQTLGTGSPGEHATQPASDRSPEAAPAAPAGNDQGQQTQPAAGESGGSGEELTTAQILEALKGVFDPELMVNVVDLGLVYNVEVKGNEVKVDLGLTSPLCPAGPQMMMQAKQAIEALRPGIVANVRLTLDPPWTPDRMSEEARNQLGFF